MLSRLPCFSYQIKSANYDELKGEPDALISAVSHPVAAICIVAERYNIRDGLGDLYFAVHLWKTLQQYELKNIQVTLHPLRDFEEESFRELKEPPVLTSMAALQQTAQHIPVLVIHGPVTNHSLPPLNDQLTTVWHMHEYNREYKNHQDGKMLLTGIGDNHWGINCNPWLYRLGKDLEKQGKNSDLTYIEKLQNAPLKKLLLDKKSDSTLYFGYSQFDKTKIDFIARVVGAHCSLNDIDICLIKSQGDDFLNRLTKSIEERVTLDVSQIEVHDYNNVTEQFDLTLTRKISDSGRTLRLIRTGALSESDFIHLMIASSRFILVTGNQSAAQAIMLRKTVYIELIVDKFIIALAELASRLGHPIVDGFLRAEDKSPYPFFNEMMATGFGALADEIYNHFNLEVNIKRHIGIWASSQKQKSGQSNNAEKSGILKPGNHTTRRFSCCNVS